MGLVGATITAEVLTDRGSNRGQGGACSSAGTMSRSNDASNLGERSIHRERGTREKVFGEAELGKWWGGRRDPGSIHHFDLVPGFPPQS